VASARWPAGAVRTQCRNWRTIMYATKSERGAQARPL